MQQRGAKQWFRRYDWDAVAGIVAAAVALVLHLLHVVQPDILLTITLALVALLLLRQLRHEEREERVDQATGRAEQMLVKLQEALKLPEVVGMFLSFSASQVGPALLVLTLPSRPLLP